MLSNVLYFITPNGLTSLEMEFIFYEEMKEKSYFKERELWRNESVRRFKRYPRPENFNNYATLSVTRETMLDIISLITITIQAI